MYKYFPSDSCHLVFAARDESLGVASAPSAVARSLPALAAVPLRREQPVPARAAKQPGHAALLRCQGLPGPIKCQSVRMTAPRHDSFPANTLPAPAGAAKCRCPQRQAPRPRGPWASGECQRVPPAFANALVASCRGSAPRRQARTAGTAPGRWERPGRVCRGAGGRSALPRLRGGQAGRRWPRSPPLGKAAIPSAPAERARGGKPKGQIHCLTGKNLLGCT